ncbi:MAG TPA: YtxH domain-containing protein [Candidatus Limnocylindria bacterium]|nr:YtxH domain-containing protein [Candidatus Limnocylindria bacterium]
MSKRAEDDMNAIKDLKLDDVLDDLRAEAAKRIDRLVSEGRKQARSAGGGHDDTALFSAFTLGILAGAIVGAAIALLVTPFSGTQARAKLSEKVEKLRSDQVSWDTTAPSGNGKAAGAYEPTYTSPKPVS